MLMITSKSSAPDSVNLYSVDFLSLLIGIFFRTPSASSSFSLQDKSVGDNLGKPFLNSLNLVDPRHSSRIIKIFQRDPNISAAIATGQNYI